MPAGLGLHPWFRGPIEVQLAGSQVVPSDLDDPAVVLRWPDLGLSAQLSVRSGTGRCVALASPASLPAVAIEPQTHLPDGLGRFLRGEPGGLTPLAPGAPRPSRSARPP